MRRFGLIGKKLKHSFSKNYFTKKFENENISDCSYELFELSTIEEFPELIKKTPGLQGLNITIPYKEDVIKFLTKKTKVVDEIQACNCIKILEDQLIGYNTDVIGFKESLQPKLKSHHNKALVLGSGGASKAVQYSLKELGIAYYVVSRRKKFNQLGYEDVGKDVIDSYTLIINTTPLGMFPNVNDDPPIPYEYITSKHFLFDLVYNPGKSKFLKQGEEYGAQIANGHEMLVLQAEESWKIWNED